MKKKTSKKTTSAKREPSRTLTLPNPRKGEIYKGLVVDQTGKPLHHVIELACDSKKAWGAAVDHAKKMGYALPSRQEGALLRASDPGGLTGWFWLNTQCEPNADFAWAQHFNLGDQGDCRKGYEFRVRLVRSVSVID